MRGRVRLNDVGKYQDESGWRMKRGNKKEMIDERHVTPQVKVMMGAYVNIIDDAHWKEKMKGVGVVNVIGNATS